MTVLPDQTFFGNKIKRKADETLWSFLKTYFMSNIVTLDDNIRSVFPEMKSPACFVSFAFLLPGIKTLEE